MNFASKPRPPVGSQQGTVLVIALIMLVLLTIVGIGAMRGTLLAERMAGNTRDLHRAMHAAELGLREAEMRILDEGEPGSMAVGQCNDPNFATRPQIAALFASPPVNFETDTVGGVQAGGGYCPPELREKNKGSAAVGKEVWEIEFYTVIGVGISPGGAHAVTKSVFAVPGFL